MGAAAAFPPRPYLAPEVAKSSAAYRQVTLPALNHHNLWPKLTLAAHGLFCTKLHKLA